jgi:small subunit ribosomal protein S2
MHAHKNTQIAQTPKHLAICIGATYNGAITHVDMTDEGPRLGLYSFDPVAGLHQSGNAVRGGINRKSKESRPMALPQFTMRQLLEAGVHFGHQTHRWNPKMDRFIFGSRNKIHIIDLAQTVPLLHQALVLVSDVVARGGRVLYVGTKRQASEAVADSAKRAAQYYVNHRWLGGMLTNWKTITNSIRRLRQLDELLGGESHGLTKKELLQLTRERDKLDKALGGIRDMGGLPDLMFVIDTNKEAIAVAEARKLGIPVVAVVDSNSDPDGIDYVVPGNDDAGRAITLYCDLVARAALDGIERGAVRGGVDIGASVEPVAEALNGAGETPAEEGAAADTGDSNSNSNGDGGITGLTPLAEPDGNPDDLTKLTGVGKAMASKLNGQGIYHFAQLAALPPESLEALDSAIEARGKAKNSGWIEEAKKLMGETASEPAA